MGEEITKSNEESNEESNEKTKGFFKLGHIFTKAELPEGKEYLEGSLYFARNEDDTMRVILPKEIKATTWEESEISKAEFQKHLDDSIRKGSKQDWKKLLSSTFVDEANINPGEMYWEDGEHPDNDDLDHKLVGVFYPDKSGSTWAQKDIVEENGESSQKGNIRFFADIEKFDPEPV